eukprot:g3541.t1
MKMDMDMEASSSLVINDDGSDDYVPAIFPRRGRGPSLAVEKKNKGAAVEVESYLAALAAGAACPEPDARSGKGGKENEVGTQSAGETNNGKVAVGVGDKVKEKKARKMKTTTTTQLQHHNEKVDKDASNSRKMKSKMRKGKRRAVAFEEDAAADGPDEVLENDHGKYEVEGVIGVAPCVEMDKTEAHHLASRAIAMEVDTEVVVAGRDRAGTEDQRQTTLQLVHRDKETVVNQLKNGRKSPPRPRGNSKRSKLTVADVRDSARAGTTPDEFFVLPEFFANILLIGAEENAEDLVRELKTDAFFREEDGGLLTKRRRTLADLRDAEFDIRKLVAGNGAKTLEERDGSSSSVPYWDGHQMIAEQEKMTDAAEGGVDETDGKEKMNIGSGLEVAFHGVAQIHSLGMNAEISSAGDDPMLDDDTTGAAAGIWNEHFRNFSFSAPPASRSESIDPQEQTRSKSNKLPMPTQSLSAGAPAARSPAAPSMQRVDSFELAMNAASKFNNLEQNLFAALDRAQAYNDHQLVRKNEHLHCTSRNIKMQHSYRAPTSRSLALLSTEQIFVERTRLAEDLVKQAAATATAGRGAAVGASGIEQQQQGAAGGGLAIADGAEKQKAGVLPSPAGLSEEELAVLCTDVAEELFTTDVAARYIRHTKVCYCAAHRFLQIPSSSDVLTGFIPVSAEAVLLPDGAEQNSADDLAQEETPQQEQLLGAGGGDSGRLLPSADHGVAAYRAWREFRAEHGRNRNIVSSAEEVNEAEQTRIRAMYQELRRVEQGVAKYRKKNKSPVRQNQILYMELEHAGSMQPTATRTRQEMWQPPDWLFLRFLHGCTCTKILNRNTNNPFEFEKFPAQERKQGKRSAPMAGIGKPKAKKNATSSGRKNKSKQIQMKSAKRTDARAATRKSAMKRKTGAQKQKIPRKERNYAKKSRAASSRKNSGKAEKDEQEHEQLERLQLQLGTEQRVAAEQVNEADQRAAAFIDFDVYKPEVEKHDPTSSGRRLKPRAYDQVVQETGRYLGSAEESKGCGGQQYGCWCNYGF